MDDIVSQKLKELRNKTKCNFSDDEVAKFINLGNVLASKSVLHALCHVLHDGRDKKVGHELVKKVTELMPYDYSGHSSISFHEIPYKLNIFLSLVDRNYRTDIDIPSEDYSKDLYEQYNFLKKVAVAYWKQFSEENPDLLKEISIHRPDLDFTSLIIDANNPTTMYFDPECSKRIGIFCCYVDEKGVPFYKKAKNNI